MSGFDYVEIPSHAKRLDSVSPTSREHEMIRPAPKVTTSLPHPESIPDSPMSSPTAQATSPSRSVFGNLPGLLLASTLQLSANVPLGNMRNNAHLMSTRDPLSVPITTAHFRRFVARVGPVFWFQDRVEEIFMWRKGWKVTGAWMAGYAFICYFPRLILLLPHAIILGILLATHPSRWSPDPETVDGSPQLQPPPRVAAREGSADWLSNIQAIQNLMGIFSDVYDAVFPYIPHLTYSTLYTPHILTITLLTFLLALPLLPLVPLRPLFLSAGLLPFLLTHPISQRTLPILVSNLPLQRIHASVVRAVDDDRLKDEHWRSPLREVELFENERWVPSDVGTSGGWGKVHLKPSERVAWTRGRDGWSGVSADGGGNVSNLTFALDAGWAFVETEDWRADVEARWSAVGADELGWVYTNDAWLEPRVAPSEEWKVAGGMTRRRRWTRRIYLNPISVQ